MNDIIVDVNTEAPIGVTRFQIIDDGKMQDFDKDHNVVEKQYYAIAASKNGSQFSVIGEMTRDDLITLGILIHRFIDETKEV